MTKQEILDVIEGIKKKKIYRQIPFPVEVLAESNNIIMTPNIFEDKYGQITLSSLSVKNGKVTISYNPCLNRKERRFHIAYHLGHYFLHKDVKNRFTDELNEEAKVFAAELLVPDQHLLATYENTFIPALSYFADKYCVPKQLIRAKFERLNLDYVNL